jgi:MFS family permease
VPAFRRLWAAQLISELGDWVARLALSVLVYSRTGSPALAGAVVAVSLLPWLGPGQLLAAAAERWPRRRVLIVADLTRAGAFAVAAAPLPMPVLFGLVFLGGLATPPFEAARSALRPEIVPPRLFGAAVAVTGITNDLTVALGYLTGGALLVMIDAEAALLCNAGSFCLSALLLAGLPAAGAPATLERRRLRAGYRVLRSDPLIVRACLLVVGAMLPATALAAMSAPLALGVLGAGPGTAGALVAGTFAASIAATAALPVHHGPDQLLRRAATYAMLSGIIVTGGFLGVAAVSTNRTAPAAVAYVAAGLLFAVMAAANMVVSPRLPTHVRASALSLLMGVLTAVEAIGAIGVGLAAGSFGLLVVCTALGMPALAVGSYAFATGRPSLQRVDRGGRVDG